MGRYDAYRTSIMDEPSASKLGNRHARETNRRSVESGCHRSFTHHTYALVGYSTRRTILPNAMQFHGPERRDSTCEPAGHHRETHRGLREVNSAVPLGHGGDVQGFSAAAHPSRFHARGRVLTFIRANTLGSYSRVRTVQREAWAAEYQQKIG